MPLPGYGQLIARMNLADLALELNDLSDVVVAAPAADEVLVYDGVDTWRNRPIVAAGTYTGDGTLSQAITGVGFQPKYVRIWPRETVSTTAITVFETTETMVDDNAAGMAAAQSGFVHFIVSDAIISLDADGFTVDDGGANQDPNTDGQVYNFLAIG